MLNDIHTELYLIWSKFKDDLCCNCLSGCPSDYYQCKHHAKVDKISNRIAQEIEKLLIRARNAKTR